jgi:UDP-glucose 4-epimerase
VTDAQAVRDAVDVDVIFHLASINSPKPPSRAFHVNMQGTNNILEAMKKETLLVYASTGSVYGKPVYSPQDEKHPCVPTDPYSLSKYAAEGCINYSVHSYNLKAVILRLYNVVGIGQNRENMLSTFIKQALMGEPVQIMGDGKQKRCFTAVEDVIQAFILVAFCPAAYGKVFNIAGSETLTVEQIAETISNTEPVYVNPKSELPSFEPSIKLAQETFGYSPKKRLRDVLPKLMEWLKGEMLVEA